MSEKYKDALNKIVVTDELKEKIIANASSQKTMPTAVTETKTKRMRYSRLRYGMNMAACFLICVSALLASKYVYNPDISPIDETISGTDEQYQNNNTNAVVPPVKDNDNPNNNSVRVVPSNNSKANTTQNNPPLNNTLSANNAKPENLPISTDNSSANVENMDNGSNINLDTSGEPPIMDTDVFVQNPSVDNAGLAVNPIYSAENIEELQKQVGYVFKLPQYLPDDYTVGACGVLFGSLIEVNYNSENNSILYRTEKMEGNISGDYNEYERVETETVNNTEVTLKSTNDLYYNAVWNDDSAYALNIENGMDKETIMKIVESVDYPTGETAEADNCNKSDTKTETEIEAEAEAETEEEAENSNKSDTETEIIQNPSQNEMK